MGQLCCCCKKSKTEQHEKFLIASVQTNDHVKNPGDYKSPSYEMIVKIKGKSKSKRHNNQNDIVIVEPACWFNDYRQSRNDKNEFIQQESPIDIVNDNFPGSKSSNSSTGHSILNFVNGKPNSSNQLRSSSFDTIDNIDNYSISLKYCGIDTNKCGLINNGQTIEAICGHSNNCIILTHKEYKDLCFRFRLKSFHFHTPCEHLINHEMFDMELHLIHECSETLDIAIIVVLFETGISRSDLWPELTGSGSGGDSGGGISGSNGHSANSSINSNQSSNLLSKHLGLSSFASTNKSVHGHLGSHSRSITMSKSISTRFARFNNQSFTDNEFLSQFWDQMPRFQNVKYPSSVRNVIRFEKLLLFAQNEFNMNDKNDTLSKQNISKNDIFRKWNNMLENTESKDLFEEMYGNLPLSVKYCLLLMNEENKIKHQLCVDFYYYAEYCQNVHNNRDENDDNEKDNHNHHHNHIHIHSPKSEEKQTHAKTTAQGGHKNTGLGNSSNNNSGGNNENNNSRQGGDNLKNKEVNRNVTVRWFISKKIQKMSYKQFRKLRDIQSYVNNVRQCKDSHNVSYQVLPKKAGSNDSQVATIPSKVSFVE